MSWDGKVYGKYVIAHADGTPLHGKEYFVLRLDSDDPAEAARVKAAMAAYKGEACPEGDAAKARKALIAISDMATPSAAFGTSALVDRIFVEAARALAAPPRNCDRFDTGDVEQDADAALRAMLDEMKSDGNFGYRGIASYLLSPARTGVAGATETPEPPKGGEMCGDNRFELIASAKKELLRCTNIEGSPDEMAVLDSLLFRMWQMRWLPGCRRHDGASEVACNVDHVDIDHVLKIGRDFQAQDRWRGAQFDTAKLLCDTIEALRARLAEAAGTEAKPAPASLFPKGVRPATEEEVEAGDAQWCEVCRTTCPCKGKDMLVHGCSQAATKDGLS